MAKNYVVTGPNTSQAAPATLWGLTSGAASRPRVFDITIGSTATPADQAALYGLYRFTAAGTATAQTPAPTDNQEVAAVTVAGITHTVEPTYAAPILLQVPLNQRATFRYVASPGAEFVGTAGAATGLGLKYTIITSAFVAYSTVLFTE